MGLILALILAVASLVGSPLQPCASEDTEGSTACYWDASARGNGQGQSFIWTGSTTVLLSR